MPGRRGEGAQRKHKGRRGKRRQSEHEGRRGHRGGWNKEEDADNGGGVEMEGDAGNNREGSAEAEEDCIHPREQEEGNRREEHNRELWHLMASNTTSDHISSPLGE
ncbi:hypothetical protein NDU88_004354 [Pleurodeles waltl]|uniref:Uncharacterized protein n=1 Tax=Pleurodeles waltl TaxID=8319 RepID=A0AAV7LI22_PLEWA|nr:hypothetical protein NDU88_004354 [Pleurodeles waltl]